MSLLDILRTGVKIANQITQPVQALVMLAHEISHTGAGTGTYAAPVSIKALVDWKRTQVRTASGELSVTRAVVTFLDVEALKEATNGEGIGDYDRITLPDGTIGPILDQSGFIDAGTGRPFATEVMLG